MLLFFLAFLATAIACIVFTMKASYGGTVDQRQRNAVLVIVCGLVAAASFAITLILFIIKALS